MLAIWRSSSMLLVLALLGACTTTRTTGTTTDDACLVLGDVIRYSASEDSKSTVDQVREKNAKIRAYCGS